MEERGWSQEFRTMGKQVLIEKKLALDLGLEKAAGGQQNLIKNLLQIIQVEVLLKNVGWANNPRDERDSFESLQGEILCEDLTKFWELCSENKVRGLLCLAKHKPVEFLDVCSLLQEKEDKQN